MQIKIKPNFLPFDYRYMYIALQFKNLKYTLRMNFM